MYLHDEYNSSAYYNTFREFQQNSSTATIILASKPHSSTTKTPPMFLTLSGLALESLLLSWKVSNEYDFQMRSIFKVIRSKTNYLEANGHQIYDISYTALECFGCEQDKMFDSFVQKAALRAMCIWLVYMLLHNKFCKKRFRYIML